MAMTTIGCVVLSLCCLCLFAVVSVRRDVAAHPTRVSTMFLVYFAVVFSTPHTQKSLASNVQKYKRMNRKVVLDLRVGTAAAAFAECEAEAVLNKAREVPPEVDVGTGFHARRALRFSFVNATNDNVHWDRHKQNDNEHKAAADAITAACAAAAVRAHGDVKNARVGFFVDFEVQRCRSTAVECNFGCACHPLARHITAVSVGNRRHHRR